MHQLGDSDYINEPKGNENTDSRVRYKTERKLYWLLLFSFGILCIIQAALNVSLRLVASSRKQGDNEEASKETVPTLCKVIHDGVKEKNDETVKPIHCNDLLERFNALTGEKNLLQNRNNILTNTLRMVTEERDKLRNTCDSPGLPVPSKRCPSDWTEVNSSCYFLSTAAETWEISRKRCQSKRADLAVIESMREQRLLHRLDDDASLSFWIGLSNTRTFQWVDGSALKKSFWSDHSVGNGGSDRSKVCVVMNNSKPLIANWDIAPCEHKHRWLCEKSLV